MKNTFHLLTLIIKGQKLFPLKQKIKITLTLAGAQTDPPRENALIFSFLINKLKSLDTRF